MKISVISDLHFDPLAIPDDSSGRTVATDELLQRAVYRINEVIRPDITLVLGDLLEHGEGPDAKEQLACLKTLIDLLESPVIVIPGNHDCAPEIFYTVFEEPPPIYDICDIRFLVFIDPEEPEYNARRTEHDLRRFAQARSDFKGPIVALQHVPVFLPGDSLCPFNYTNAEEIISEMSKYRVNLSISGHYHEGMEITTGGVFALTAPAMCDMPFRFLDVDFDGNNIHVKTHELKMSEE